MTRKKSKREIAHTVEDLERQAGVSDCGPFREVYRDPLTGRCFEGRAPDAAPIEELPEDSDLLVITRAVSMMRADAVADGREVIDVLDEREDGEVVSVRVEPAPGVDTTAAATVDADALAPTIDFSGADT